MIARPVEIMSELSALLETHLIRFRHDVHWLNR
jgi:hypothetical protein